MRKLNIKGLIAAPFTPMNQDGSLNIDVIKDYALKLKADKIEGVFICGTTGEGMLMSDQERMEVAEKWMKFKSENFKIIVHVGNTSYKLASVLAAHAQQIGVDAIATIGPVFLPPGDIDSLVLYCQHISSAAPQLPFYYYHMPVTSNVRVSMGKFLTKAGVAIPNLAGIKFTDSNLMEMQQCISTEEGKYEIMHGSDEILLCGLSLGVKSAVGSTYNYLAPMYKMLYEAFEKGNLAEARKFQQYSVKVVEVLNQFGGPIRAGKAIMGLIGIECGPCRTPIRRMNDDEYKQLKEKLTEINFFDFIGNESTY